MKEGLFWVIASTEQGLSNGEFNILTHFVRDESHVNVWQQITQGRADLSQFQYDHFPRGRIWINDKGIPIIFINPALDLPIVIEKIKEVFELNAEVEICHDGVTPIKTFMSKYKEINGGRYGNKNR